MATKNTKSKIRIATTSDVIQLFFAGWDKAGVCQENPAAAELADRARKQMQSQVKAYLVDALAEHVIARRAIRRKAFDLAGQKGSPIELRIAIAALGLALESLKDEAKLLGLYRSPLTERLEILESKLL
jgi:hypothetical protein